MRQQFGFPRVTSFLRGNSTRPLLPDPLQNLGLIFLKCEEGLLTRNTLNGKLHRCQQQLELTKECGSAFQISMKVFRKSINLNASNIFSNGRTRNDTMCYDFGQLKISCRQSRFIKTGFKVFRSELSRSKRLCY